MAKRAIPAQMANGTIPESDRPLSRGCEGWTDYIMGFAADNECKVDDKGKKAPFVHFLRRITKQEWGEVIFSQPLDVQIHQLDDYDEWSRVATVTYGIKIKDRETGQIYEYADVADVHEKNCDFPFFKFGPASASTRAESRAYRKALILNIVGAEELSKVAFEKDEPRQRSSPPANSRPAGILTPTQENGIVKQCKDMKIDPDLFVQECSSRGCTKVAELTEDEAKDALKYLTRLFGNRSEIPDGLKNTFKPA